MGVFKNDVGRPSNKTVMIRNILKGLGIVLIAALAFGIGYYFNNVNKVEDKTKTDSKTEVKDGWYTPTGTAKEMKLYGCKYEKDEYNDEYLTFRETEHEDYDDINNMSYKYLNTYKCENSDCTIFTWQSFDFKTIVIKDKDFIVYNFKENKAKKIDFGKYSDNVKYLYNETQPCDLGSICVSTKKAGNKTYYVFEVISEISSPIVGIIDPNFKPILFATDEEYKDDNFWEQAYSYATFLDNGKMIYKGKDKFYTYDYKTGDNNSSKKYKSVELISKGYIVVVDENSNLKVLDLKGKEKAKLGKVTSDMFIHSALSGWFEQDKKAGIYVVVQDPDATFDELSSEMKKELNNEDNGIDYGYEYYYIPSTGETGKIATYIGGYAKPVLYLYPTKDNTKISVSFAKPELLTTTYPKYKNSWEVTANKNGDLKDKDNKYYYGLYWEENGSINVKFNEGFYVTKDNAIEFLEEKLTTIGLNDREKNEFIMYWLPILEKNEKNLVYFELTKSREAYNKLNINPKPDSLLRVAIHIKKVDKKINIKAQKLTTFERKGFTAVEWGGVIH